jgi:ribosomal protein S18 acetylase RimI-like enzyme
MENLRLQILEYEPSHQPTFEKLNRDWIEQYFYMEPLDEDVLRFPDKHIIAQGGSILMAQHAGEMAGTVALKIVEPGVYEFTKMAVEPRFRGLQIGKALALSAIEKAKALGATKIILYSNTILEPAIALYRKLGFIEVPVDGPYKRSNIKMELILSNPPDISIRTATLSDAELLTSIGMNAFYDTFAEVNTKDDMDLYLSKNFTVDRLSSELNDANSTFLLAEDEGKPAGYAKVRKSPPPEGLQGSHSIEIERLYACREYIGKQVGRKLMQECLDLVKQGGYDVVWLGVWEHNHRAIAFYEKSGFKKFSTHPFMLGNDLQTDFLMMKELK